MCYTCAAPVGHVKRRPGRLQTADRADHADCADLEFFTMYHFYLLFFYLIFIVVWLISSRLKFIKVRCSQTFVLPFLFSFLVRLQATEKVKVPLLWSLWIMNWYSVCRIIFLKYLTDWVSAYIKKANRNTSVLLLDLHFQNYDDKSIKLGWFVKETAPYLCRLQSPVSLLEKYY